MNEGQITFDDEGTDYITATEPLRQRRYPNFSRILQWPPTSTSGVTPGRGYDMGNRSTGEIYPYRAPILDKNAIGDPGPKWTS